MFFLLTPTNNIFCTIEEVFLFDILKSFTIEVDYGISCELNWHGVSANIGLC